MDEVFLRVQCLRDENHEQFNVRNQLRDELLEQGLLVRLHDIK